MASIGSLTASLKLESATFVRELGKAAQATKANTDRMSRDMAALRAQGQRITSTFKAIGAGLIGAASIRSLTNLAKASINAGDEIATSAAKIGIAADEFQRFRFAAAQADVEAGELDTALRRFAQSLAEGKIATEAGSMAEAFRETIQRIADAPTELEKTRIAYEAFGRQFQSALLLAAQGADEFRKQADGAFVLSDKALASAGRLDNQLRELQNAVGAGFSTGLLESFGDGLESNRQGLERLNSAAQTVGRNLGGFLDVAIQRAQEFRDWLNRLDERLRSFPKFDPFGLSSYFEGLADTKAQLPDLNFGDFTIPADETKKFASSMDDVAKASKAANDEWKRGTKILAEEMNPAAKQLQTTLDTFSFSTSSAFADLIVEGRKFNDVVKEIGNSLARTFLQTSAETAITSLIGGTGSTNGLLANIFHGGGVVGRGSPPKREIPAATFLAAPRLHNGLRADEFPAILQAGETVIPKGGSDAPVINIVNNTSARIGDAEAKPTPGGRPGRDWTLQLDEITAKNLRRGGSASNQAVKGLGGRAPLVER